MNALVDTIEMYLRIIYVARRGTVEIRGTGAPARIETAVAHAVLGARRQPARSMWALTADPSSVSQPFVAA